MHANCKKNYFQLSLKVSINFSSDVVCCLMIIAIMSSKENNFPRQNIFGNKLLFGHANAQKLFFGSLFNV